MTPRTTRPYAALTMACTVAVAAAALTAVALAGLLLPGSSAFAQQKVALTNDKEKASYIIGMNIGASLKRDNVEIDQAAFNQGMKDALAGTPARLNPEETKEVMTRFQKNLQAGQETRQKTAGEKNRKDGETFLAKNKKEPGVTSTTSGLQYKVLKEGTGRTATLADTVTANYRGTLIDGTEFDSSYKRGEPAKFPVTGVIPGWTEVLQLMKIGSKYQVFIPAKLAYGDRGAGQQIGPNSTLIFEIELLDAKQE
jgi:FKBP-type peptidyl-prolyl cis-trans isomerase FklB